MKPTSWQNFIAMARNWKSLRRLLQMSCKYSLTRLSSRSQTSESTSTQHWSSTMQASYIDCNSTSIAKTLLVQMQQCSFHRILHYELAWVLGTHQHAISKASTKPVSSRSVEGQRSGEEDAPTPPSTKSQAKKDKKISATVFWNKKTSEAS